MENQNTENVKPSKRFRNPNSHKRTVNKVSREKGLEYVTKKGKIIQAEKFNKTICKCRLSCHLTVDESSQKEIFQHFYSLPSWSEKTMFLVNHIKVKECQKRRKPENRKCIRFKKNFTRQYFFNTEDQNVCKTFFTKVLQISIGKIEKCMKKREKFPDSYTVDLRGRHKKHRKTSTV